MYLQGDGVERSEARAEELFQLADAQGFDVESFREQLGL